MNFNVFLDMLLCSCSFSTIKAFPDICKLGFPHQRLQLIVKFYKEVDKHYNCRCDLEIWVVREFVVLNNLPHKLQGYWCPK